MIKSKSIFSSHSLNSCQIGGRLIQNYSQRYKMDLKNDGH